ncbi:hypothetical protein [Methylosinus sp. PW1]|uniref:hypothetical protein n=1 Tax=Methylosinus sp. PW1 TaxID=107636 RepID=UPI000A5BB2E1|nr:hypothetical protein [Methylosinus sp. PW1]
MSAIRDTARPIIDRALPEGRIITSNGATASQYSQTTGLSQKALTDNWAHSQHRSRRPAFRSRQWPQELDSRAKGPIIRAILE